MSYVFPGVASYIVAAAIEAGVPPADVGRVHQSWHVARIQDALGQLPNVVESSRPEVLAYAVGVRAGLVASLAAVDAAIVDAAAGVGLLNPLPADEAPTDEPDADRPPARRVRDR